jgi:DNA-binding NtrC family response regulator
MTPAMMTPGTKVLIADDESMLRSVAAEILSDSGFTVIEAHDGVEALQALRDHSDIQLLISDVRMPRMSGYALVDAGIAVRPELKVLLMTGYSREPLPEHLTERGVQILYKPFDLEMLPTLARQSLETH